MRKKIAIIVFSIFSLFILTSYINVNADSMEEYSKCLEKCEKKDNDTDKKSCKTQCINENPNSAKYDKYDENDCRGILGSPTDEDSVAWLIQQLFSIVKYLGPFLVLVLGSIDFAKTIIINDDEAMKKAQKKLIIRLILVVALFFVPTFIMAIFQIFDIVGDPSNPTCSIK